MKKKWKCVCGYIHDGDTAPDQCPKCGAPAEKFTLLDDKAANLVERSRHTNVLHCQLVGLARKLEAACKDGIADNLDPGCVHVFETTLAHSYEIMKLAMTEMQGHIAKGKWG
ncbi:MAG: rubredoxin [Planctomycetes bacterium]|nr:rubredoxin [Planctomycetota bacterium]